MGRFFLNKIQFETLIRQTLKKGEKMKNIKIITALLIMLAGNAALFSSNASAYVYVNGYLKSNGTYVESHIRTEPDGVCWNNFSGC